MKITGSKKASYESIENNRKNKISKNKKNENKNLESIISTDYELVQKSTKKLKELDKIERKTKVENLKLDIKNGKYKINQEEITKIIIDAVT